MQAARFQAGAGSAAALTSGFDLAFTVAIGFALVAAVALRPASERPAVPVAEPVEAEGRRAVAA